MTARYILRLYTDTGIPLTDIQPYSRLEYAQVLNDVGVFEIQVVPDFNPKFLEVDRIIEVWRTPDGGEPRQDFTGFMRWWEWSENEDGDEILRLGGADPNDLLDRRVIAFRSTTAEAEKTQEADDMLKAVVRENMGALAPNDEAGRPRAYDAAHFTVAPDATLAPSITRSFAWRDTLPVLQEIANASATSGSTPLYFNVIPTGPGQFEFRTYIDLLGIDRTSGDRPIVFTKEAGNLGSPALRIDWSDEWNYIWGGGQGEGTSRLIDPEKDVLRSHRSIWNRRERFQDAREETTALGTAAKAFQRLQEERPKLTFTGKLLDTPRSRYGIDWGFGDKVLVQYRGYEVEILVRSVHVIVDQTGQEDVQAGAEGELGTG